MLGKTFAIAAKITIAVGVILFLGLHSLNFFTFVFSGQNTIYAYLGFALTSGAVIGYLAIFKWYAPTVLRQFVAISMIGLCLIGELATAGFGMRLETYAEQGLTFTADDISTMILAVQILGVVHGLALILDFAGDDIIAAFKRQEAAIPADPEMPIIPARKQNHIGGGGVYESTTDAVLSLSKEEPPTLGGKFRPGSTQGFQAE